MSVAWLEQRSVYYLVCLAAVALALLSASSQWLPGRAELRQPARMRLFMHEVLTGPGATAVGVVNGTGPVILVGEPPLRFGQVVMIDDALTEGASPASRSLGRAQGFYAFASMHGPAVLLCMNVVLTAGPYSGSTFTVFGRDNIVEPLRELSVVAPVRRVCLHSRPCMTTPSIGFGRLVSVF
ncbi:dirigent protein 1-like [Lolium perenne]|uniref:dirigent protein 1-like n=1 Tax=Lolium perenne TaxID=4522 RepID=UPI0021F52B53|nr:dirigent protein 1-like [Lolium perenne]